MKSVSKVKSAKTRQGQSTGQTSADVLSTTEPSTIGSRIVLARGSRKQGEYAALLGVKVVTLGRYERNERRPDADFIDVMSSKGDVNPSWLLYGTEPRSFMQAAGGEPSKVWERSTVGALRAHEGMRARYDATEAFALLPLFDIRAAAGHGALAEDRAPAEHWAFSRVWLERELRIPPARLILVTISGNSMEPDLHDGDVVMVDRGDRDVLREGVYVFFLDGHNYVKRLALRDGHLSIISANAEEHPPQELSLLQENSTFRIIGRVVGQPTFKRF